MASEFNLEVEIIAHMEMFEASMKKVEGRIGATEKKVGDIASEQKGMGKLVKTAGKAVAAFAAIEIAAKAAATGGQALLGIMDAFAGESEDAMAHFEGALNSAKQLPFGIGGAIDAIHTLSLAIAGVDEQLRDLAEMEKGLLEFDNARKAAAAESRAMRDIYEATLRQIQVLETASEAEKVRVAIQQDLAVEIEKVEKQVAKATENVGKYIGGVLAMSEGMAETIRRNGEKTIEQLEKEAAIRIKIARDLEEQVKNEERTRIIRQSQADLTSIQDQMARKQLRNDAEALALLEQRIRSRQIERDFALQIEQAEKAGKEHVVRALENAKRVKMFQLEQLEHVENRARAEDAAKKAAEEAAKNAEKAEKEREKRREKAMKAEEAFMKSKLKAEKEIGKARDEANAAVQGATATFSTAGGSFTTAVSAQVNEAKILQKISEQSRDFLAQIVQNTARLGGGIIGGFA